MIGCARYRESLKAYLDRELPLTDRIRIRLHLQRCPDCRQEIFEMEEINKQLDTAKAGVTDPLKPSLRDRLLAAIPTDATAGPETRFWRRRLQIPDEWRNPRFMVWGAAATLASCFFCYTVFTHLQPELSKNDTSVASKSVAPGAESMQSAADGAATGANPPTTADGSDTGRMQTRSRNAGAMMKESYASARTMSERRSVLHSAPMAASQSVQSPMAMGKSSPISSGKSVLSDNHVDFQRQVHREADLGVEVAHLEESEQAVEDRVKVLGGYVASSQLETGTNGLRNATITSQVPVDQFDSYVNYVTKLGVVKTKSINNEDITERVSDQKEAKRVLASEIDQIEAKLRTARTRSQRREDLEDLRWTQVRLAQARARMEILQKQATFSTVTVELSELTKPVPPQQTGGLMNELKDTGQTAIQSFMGAAKLPLIVLVWLLAYSPIILVLAFAYRYVKRT